MLSDKEVSLDMVLGKKTHICLSPQIIEDCTQWCNHIHILLVRQMFTLEMALSFELSSFAEINKVYQLQKRR